MLGNSVDIFSSQLTYIILPLLMLYLSCISACELIFGINSDISLSGVGATIVKSPYFFVGAILTGKIPVFR